MLYFKPERCFKDILFILDRSGSISPDVIDGKLKPFLRRLIDDPRLDVSAAKGSNIAIMTFSEEATVRLAFNETYDKSVYYEVINDFRSLVGGRTKTFLALEKANKVCLQRFCASVVFLRLIIYIRLESKACKRSLLKTLSLINKNLHYRLVYNPCWAKNVARCGVKILLSKFKILSLRWME